MTQRSYDIIYLLECPITASHSGSVSDLIPKKLVPHQFRHWAILVDDFCYEVKSTGRDENGTRLYNTVGSSIWDWKRQHSDIKKTPIGATQASWHEITIKTIIIWLMRFEGVYQLDEKNCQNFAYLLFEGIKMDNNHRSISKSDRQMFKRLPNKLTSTVDQIELLSSNLTKTIATTTVALLATVAFNVPAALATAPGICLQIRSLWKASRDNKFLKSMKKISKQAANVVLPDRDEADEEWKQWLDDEDPTKEDKRVVRTMLAIYYRFEDARFDDMMSEIDSWRPNARIKSHKIRGRHGRQDSSSSSGRERYNRYDDNSSDSEDSEESLSSEDTEHEEEQAKEEQRRSIGRRQRKTNRDYFPEPEVVDDYGNVESQEHLPDDQYWDEGVATGQVDDVEDPAPLNNYDDRLGKEVVLYGDQLDGEFDDGGFEGWSKWEWNENTRQWGRYFLDPCGRVLGYEYDPPVSPQSSKSGKGKGRKSGRSVHGKRRE